jgi:hypothetical protein
MRTISAVIFSALTFVEIGLDDRRTDEFAFCERLIDNVPMLKPPYATLKTFADATTAPTTTKDDDWARAALAGTRMLIAEESFDAIVQMLIDSGLVPRGCAAVMLDRLSEKLLMHASGRTDTHWAIRAPELLDQAGRLSAKASALRATPRLHT